MGSHTLTRARKLACTCTFTLRGRCVPALAERADLGSNVDAGRSLQLRVHGMTCGRWGECT